MKLKRIASSKSLEFLALVPLSLLIAYVSSSVYYSQKTQSGISVTQPPVVFAKGNDWPQGSVLESDLTRVSLDLKAYPNTTLTYEQPLNISNVDLSPHEFRLSPILITPASGEPDVGNFSFVNFVMQSENGETLASLNYTTTGNIWNILQKGGADLMLPPVTQWVVHVETRAASGASFGTVAKIQIAIYTR